MSNKKLFLLFSLLITCTFLDAQNLRCSYLCMFKKKVTDKNYRADPMVLDWDGKCSAFYSESKFRYDSLSVLAFDYAGNIIDKDKYRELTTLSGGPLIWNYVDYSKRSFEYVYGFMLETVLTGGELEMPRWTISDGTEEYLGYVCRRATADYLGRTWTVLFTEEIPVSIGPSFLWGTPGLIVYAIDSEQLFCYKLMGVEQIESSRYSKSREYAVDLRKQKTKFDSISHFYEYPFEEAIKFINRLSSDIDFNYEITGIRTVDHNGRPLKSDPLFDYIPLIPDEYFNKKQK